MGAVVSINKKKDNRENAKINIGAAAPLTDKSFQDESEDEARVDDFIHIMVNLGNKNDMITSILTNGQSRRHFVEYLRQEFHKDKLVIRCWQDIANEIIGNDELRKKYSGGGTRVPAVKAKVLCDFNNQDFKSNINQILSTHRSCHDLSQKSSRGTVYEEDTALILFMRICSSPQYLQWRAEVQADALSITATALACSGKQHTALGPIESSELTTIANCSSWLPLLLTSVENLPICFTMSTASKDRPGFPLIYVNKSFEQTSGYDRMEIIGRNCKFLQGSYTPCAKQLRSLRVISDALMNAKRLAPILLTNFMKDGTPFVNLLTMKPIFDQHRAYRYVVGLQYKLPYATLDEISDEMRERILIDTSPLTLKLLKIIPDDIFVE